MFYVIAMLVRHCVGPPTKSVFIELMSGFGHFYHFKLK